MKGQPVKAQPAKAQPPVVGKKKQHVLFVSVIGVILLLASFLVGLTVGMKSGVLPGDKTVAACDESALLQRLQDAGYLPPDIIAGAPVYNLEGTIGTIGSDYFDVTTSLTPLDDPATFRVTVGPDTILVLQTQKDPEKFDREMEAFDRAMETFDPETDTPPEPPEPHSLKTITVSELLQGMTVNVSSEADMRANPTFMAAEVYVEELPMAPEPVIEDAPIEEPASDESAEEPPVEEPPVEDLPFEAPPIEEPPVE